MAKTDCASNSLCCPMSMPPAISRIGYCEAAQMPKMSLRRPYFARTVSCTAFMVEMSAHGAIGARDGCRRRYEHGATGPKVLKHLGNYGREQQGATSGDYPVDSR